MQSSTHFLSIIIPIHNQANHIKLVIESYIQALAYLACKQEYILVVNACQDNSLSICRELSDKFQNIKVISSKANGWGRAIQLGLSKSAGDLICYTNSARTSPQDLLLSVCYAIANPNVVIKANRKIRETIKRRIGSLLYNLECRLLFDLAFWDINGTPKIFPRSYEKLLSLKREDDLIDLEFNIICKKNNYSVLEVPIFCNKRASGKSTTNYLSAIKLYWGAYKMWSEYLK